MKGGGCYPLGLELISILRECLDPTEILAVGAAQ